MHKLGSAYEMAFGKGIPNFAPKSEIRKKKLKKKHLHELFHFFPKNSPQARYYLTPKLFQ